MLENTCNFTLGEQVLQSSQHSERELNKKKIKADDISLLARVLPQVALNHYVNAMFEHY